MEGLFSHFFSPHRPGYHQEDREWFLELANQQDDWCVPNAFEEVIGGTSEQNLLDELQKSIFEKEVARTATLNIVVHTIYVLIAVHTYVCMFVNVYKSPHYTVKLCRYQRVLLVYAHSRCISHAYWVNVIVTMKILPSLGPSFFTSRIQDYMLDKCS